MGKIEDISHALVSFSQADVAVAVDIKAFPDLLPPFLVLGGVLVGQLFPENVPDLVLH